MAVPIQVDDGNFTVPKQVGSASYTLPFADKGDFTSFQVTLPAQMDINNFYAFHIPALGSQRSFPRGNAYLADVRNMRESGNQLLSWEYVYASVPITRTEYGSTVYDWYFIDVAAEDIGVISEKVPARILYEYQRGTPLEDQYRPRPVKIGGIWVAWAGYTGEPASGAWVLAEDTVTSIYIGNIYERRSVYVQHRDLGSLIFP